MCWLVSHGCWILENKKHYQCYSQTHLFIKTKLHANGVLNLEKSPGLVWQHGVNTFPNSQFQHCWVRWWRVTAQYLYLKQYRLCSIFTLYTGHLSFCGLIIGVIFQKSRLCVQNIFSFEAQTNIALKFSSYCSLGALKIQKY